MLWRSGLQVYVMRDRARLVWICGMVGGTVAGVVRDRSSTRWARVDVRIQVVVRDIVRRFDA